MGNASRETQGSMVRVVRAVAVILAGVSLGVGATVMVRRVVVPGRTDASQSRGDDVAEPGPRAESLDATGSPTRPPAVPALDAYPVAVRALVEETFHGANSSVVPTADRVTAFIARLTAILVADPTALSGTVAGAVQAARESRLLESEVVCVAVGRTWLPEAQAALAAAGDGTRDSRLRVVLVRAIAQADPSRPGASTVGLVHRGLVDLGAPIRNDGVLELLLRWHESAAEPEFGVRMEILWAVSGNLDDPRVVAALLRSLAREGRPPERDLARLLCYRGSTMAISSAAQLQAALRDSLLRTGESDTAHLLDLRDAVARGIDCPSEVRRIVDEGEPSQQVSLLRALPTLDTGVPLREAPWAVDIVLSLSASSSRAVREASLPAIARLIREAPRRDNIALLDRVHVMLTESSTGSRTRQEAASVLASACIDYADSRLVRGRVEALLMGAEVPANAREAVLAALTGVTGASEEFDAWRSSLTRAGAPASGQEGSGPR